MECIKCGGKTKVVDSVHTDYTDIYRRRRCTNCGYIFHTVEMWLERDDQFDIEWTKFHRRSNKKKGETK